MAKIEAVLFDFGGVFTVSPFTAFDDIGRQLGAGPGVIQQLVFGAYHEDNDHPWHRLERGEISLEDTREHILRSARDDHGLEIDIYQIFASMPRDAGIRQPLVEKVADIKQRGLARAIITNNVKEFSDAWRSLLPVDELFDLVVDSSAEGVRKPDPAIFELTLQRMGGLAPEQTLFLDDFAGNIEAADKLGMHTILVKEDIEDTLRQLDQYLR